MPFVLYLLLVVLKTNPILAAAGHEHKCLQLHQLRQEHQNQVCEEC